MRVKRYYANLNSDKFGWTRICCSDCDPLDWFPAPLGFVEVSKVELMLYRISHGRFRKFRLRIC